MSANSCLMGIDIGAGSLKVSLVSTAGALLGSASEPLETLSPKPGWAEQDAETWYTAMCRAIREAMAIADIDAGQIAGVSFSAGAHSSVIMDDAYRPLRPAIMWMDQRSGKEAAELRKNHGKEVLATGYNLPAPTWTLPQLLWVTREEPEIAARARHLLPAKDYLRFRVTGRLETDIVDAQGLLLYDCPHGRWSEKLLSLAGWNAATMPSVALAPDHAGAVTEMAARDTGLHAGTPVIIGSSDTAIELFGAGAVEPGQGGVKLATAGTISVVSREPDVSAGLINYSFVDPDLWYTITGTNSCASAHKWLRDLVFRDSNTKGDGAALFDDMDRLADSVPPGADGLLFHPYLNGERSPYWDPDLRADFIGLTFHHTRGHLVRALYEGIAFSLRDCLLIFQERGIAPEVMRLVGGGAKSRLWQQIVADVLGTTIEVPEIGDASYGAALMAGIGTGAFTGFKDAAAKVKIERVCTPDPAAHARYERLFDLYKRTQSALTDINHELTTFAAEPAIKEQADGTLTRTAEVVSG